LVTHHTIKARVEELRGASPSTKSSCFFETLFSVNLAARSLVWFTWQLARKHEPCLCHNMYFTPRPCFSSLLQGYLNQVWCTYLARDTSLFSLWHVSSKLLVPVFFLYNIGTAAKLIPKTQPLTKASCPARSEAAASKKPSMRKAIRWSACRQVDIAVASASLLNLCMHKLCAHLVLFNCTYT